MWEAWKDMAGKAEQGEEGQGRGRAGKVAPQEASTASMEDETGPRVGLG